MKYSTIEIKPSLFSDWTVNSYDLPCDRESGEGNISQMGFFHYPTKLGSQAAFDKLKSHMIDSYNAEIERIIDTRDSLMLLEFPQYERKGD